MFYFLSDDLTKLREIIKKVREELDAALKSIGDACEGESNTWHDNFAYEEGQRQVDMVSRRYQELQTMFMNVAVIDPPKDNLKVQIGHTVVVKDPYEKEDQVYRIGSYMCFQEDENEDGGDQVISYAAPLGQLFMGAKVGEYRGGNIGGRPRTFKIIQIR